MSLSSTICEQLYQLARDKNGENVVSNFNGVDVLIIQRHEEADHILRLNAANYRKNMAWFRLVFGPSRFSEDGHPWAIRRDLTQTYFSRFDRERTFQLAQNYALEAVTTLIKQSEKSANIDDGTMRAMTAKVLVENFFDVRLDDTDIDLGVLAAFMEAGSDYSFVPRGKTTDLYRDRLLQLPELRRKILTQLGFFRRPDVVQSPLLKDLLAADKRQTDRVVLEHEMMTFMAAGAETSAATMSWTCYLLALYPAMQEDLRLLAQQFWSGNEQNWKSLSSLAPLARFISETLRLYPPTPIVARFAIEDDYINATHIPAEQNVMISFIGVQHDKRLRPDPWKLDLSNSRAHISDGNTMAFSIGPRVCGGKHFALLELITFLSVFLTKARFELTSDEPPAYLWKSQMLRLGGQPVKVSAL